MRRALTVPHFGSPVFGESQLRRGRRLAGHVGGARRRRKTPLRLVRLRSGVRRVSRRRMGPARHRRRAVVREALPRRDSSRGLSWLTILRKREGFRAGFAGFDPERVARFGARDVKRLLNDAGIVRHRGKIEATIANAQATLAVQEATGSLASLVWSSRRRCAGGRYRSASATCSRSRPNRRRCRPRCAGTASSSSDRRPPTRRCSRSDSSTTTSTAATYGSRAIGSDATRKCPQPGSTISPETTVCAIFVTC